jgi:hypothetical protein
MDRENSITLLWPEWGSIPIPFDPQSEMQPIAPQTRIALVVLRVDELSKITL